MTTNKPVKHHHVVDALLNGKSSVKPESAIALEDIAAHYGVKVVKKYLPLRVAIKDAANEKKNLKNRGTKDKIVLLARRLDGTFRFSSDYGSISDRNQMIQESIS
jgi:hypothetical protein